MQEIIITGRTVEEAVGAACAALGLLRDEVSVEVIEMPQKRLFGSIPAKVRVYVSDDAFSVKDLLKSQDPQDGDEQKQEKRDEEIQKKPEEPKSDSEDENRYKSDETKPHVKVVEGTTDQKEGREPEGKEISFDQLPESAKTALLYLKDIAGGMKAKELAFRATEFDGGIKFLIDGEDASILIGRRGETMDALQYLCLLVSNRAGGEYCKISLDVANYREKREKTLQLLAKKVAGKVIKNKRSQTLEPMNPYERRIVHSVIQDIDGVKSESVGDDPNRRVVIFLEGDRPRPYRGREEREHSYHRRGSGEIRDKGHEKRYEERSEKPRVKQEQKKSHDPELEKNLYGKIEF